MNIGHKHHTRWSFGQIVWHKITKDQGMVVGVLLRPNSASSYIVIFDDSRNEDECLEFELTDEQPSPVEVPE